MRQIAFFITANMALFVAGVYVGTKTERAYQEHQRRQRSRAYCRTTTGTNANITTTWDYYDV